MWLIMLDYLCGCWMDSARDDMAEKNAPSSFHRVLFLRVIAK